MSANDSRTIAQYAAQVASSAPTPGGGSVAATACALSAALAEMVANVTLSGKVPPTEPSALQHVAAHGERLRARLLDLAIADEQAYGRYRDASALPRSTDDDKATRRAALDAALVASADVPMEIARAGVALLELLHIGSEHATKHVLSDVSTGAVIAEAAVRGALFTAGVNADLMRDTDQQHAYHAEIATLAATASGRCADILESVKRRA